MNSTPPDFPPSDDTIETAAATWLMERDEGFTPSRATQFVAWRAADPRHDAAVRRTERALELIAEMPAIREPLAARLVDETKIARLVFFRPPAWAAGLAAALALAAGVIWFSATRGPAPTTERYATAAARQQQVALVDGSVVNLNINTDVHIALTPAVRRVTLTSGEAHFAVAHDAARPFIVTAGDVSVRAVGTAFSVRLGEHGVEVLVTDGKVEITRADPVASTSARPALPAAHPLLVSGERALIAREASPAAATVEQVAAVELQSAVRWHSPIVTFSDLPLHEVLTLFNRRNPTQLVLADSSLGERKIGGTFAADQVDAFVRLLVQDGDLAVECRTATEIVLRRAR